MKLNIKGKVKYYTFSHIENTNIVKHCFSTKCGGVSTGEYASMNLGFRGNKEHTLKNYEIMCEAIGVPYKNIVYTGQIHSDKVYNVTKKDIKGIFSKIENGQDALITNEKGITLVTFYADCVPIFLLDPVKRAIGTVHSGWRGTVKEIVKKTILEMGKNFDTDPKDILAGIAPSIAKCHFQVGEDVVNIFKKELPFSEKYIKNDVEGKYKIDLQNIVRQSMIDAGVPYKNIEISGLCTVCDSDIFFSHRMMGEKRGSLASIISLSYA